ncbi:MAG: hypothetical protein LBU65_00910 [Planctomycetaceae bacterium]|nr:hypothetical protein [Planctomycetaceae bacterium]
MVFTVGCTNLRRVRFREADSGASLVAVGGGAGQVVKVGNEQIVISRRTILALRGYDLEKSLIKSPLQSLVEIREQINREPTLDLIYAFAEVAFLEAQRQESTNPKLALEIYAASALHAYGYLLDSRFNASRNSYDPHLRNACIFYNSSVEKILRLIGDKHSVELNPGSNYVIRTLDNSFNISCELKSPAWNGYEFEPFKFVSDYEICGMQNEYRQYGIGVPLLAARRHTNEKTPASKYVPSNLTFPATAVLRFLPHGSRSRDGTPLHATIELYDPLTTSAAELERMSIPLENDLTTPLAYSVADSQFRAASFLGFISPDKMLLPVINRNGRTIVSEIDDKNNGKPDDKVIRESLMGLYMIQPYEHGKIPVVFVHGLWSSPMIWMEMFNTLRSEPELRSRFQFFFYFYPTGQPFWISAAQLRHDLYDFRLAIDPQLTDSSLDKMVLVGHSMGGLVAHLQVIDSGNEFWKLASNEPENKVFAELNPKTRVELRNWFFFRPNPSVKRVITLATPYHGSEFSNNVTQWLGKTVIKVPAAIRTVTAGLNNDLPLGSLLNIETSVESLSPQVPIFDVMEKARANSPVYFNNIIGQVEQNVISRNFAASDGVVKMTSAKLERAESEIVVSSVHGDVPTHPKAILEVKRILLEHLRQ